MAIFRRLIQLEDGTFSDDRNDPLFNKFHANFTYLEATISNEDLGENDVISMVLLSSGVVTATLPDGRVSRNG